jgi:hypothetical protein
MQMMLVPHRKHTWVSTASYGDKLIILYIDGFVTLQETHLWTSTASYGDNFVLFLPFHIMQSVAGETMQTYVLTRPLAETGDSPNKRKEYCTNVTID